jgi:predicted transcriptional regulator
MKLVNAQESVEEIAESFDNDKGLISQVVEYLNNMRWIRQEQNGTYKITTKGKNNMIARQKPLINLGRLSRRLSKN